MHSQSGARLQGQRNIDCNSNVDETNSRHSHHEPSCSSAVWSQIYISTLHGDGAMMTRRDESVLDFTDMQLEIECDRSAAQMTPNDPRYHKVAFDRP